MIVAEAYDVHAMYVVRCGVHHRDSGCKELVFDGSISEVDGFDNARKFRVVTGSIRLHMSPKQIEELKNKLDSGEVI